MIAEIAIAGTVAFAIYRIVTQEKVTRERPKTGTEQILSVADGAIQAIVNAGEAIADFFDDWFARNESLNGIAAVVARNRLENLLPSEIFRNIATHKHKGHIAQDAQTVINGIISEYFALGYNVKGERDPGTWLFEKKYETTRGYSGGTTATFTKKHYYAIIPGREDTFNSVFNRIARQSKYQPKWAKLGTKDIQWFTPKWGYDLSQNDMWYFDLHHISRPASDKGNIHCLSPGEHHLYSRTVKISGDKIIKGESHRVQGWYEREAKIGQLIFFADPKYILWELYKHD